MMFQLIEDAPDSQRILGQFATEEQAREGFDGFDHKSPDCKYYITKVLTEVW